MMRANRLSKRIRTVCTVLGVSRLESIRPTFKKEGRDDGDLGQQVRSSGGRAVEPKGQRFCLYVVQVVQRRDPVDVVLAVAHQHYPVAETPAFFVGEGILS